MTAVEFYDQNISKLNSILQAVGEGGGVQSNLSGVYQFSEAMYYDVGSTKTSVAALESQVARLELYGGACAAGICMLLGAMLWRLIVLGKNQRSAW